MQSIYTATQYNLSCYDFSLICFLFQCSINIPLLPTQYYFFLRFVFIYSILVFHHEVVCTFFNRFKLTNQTQNNCFSKQNAIHFPRSAIVVRFGSSSRSTDLRPFHALIKIELKASLCLTRVATARGGMNANSSVQYFVDVFVLLPSFLVFPPWIRIHLLTKHISYAQAPEQST